MFGYSVLVVMTSDSTSGELCEDMAAVLTLNLVCSEYPWQISICLLNLLDYFMRICLNYARVYKNTI